MKLFDAPSADGVWHRCHLLPEADPAREIRDAAVVVEHGRIAWLGAEAALPAAYRPLAAPPGLPRRRRDGVARECRRRHQRFTIGRFRPFSFAHSMAMS